MNISIKNIEESLNLKKRKGPLIHCISNLFVINNLEKVILAYDGIQIISKNEEEAEEITYKSQGLLINLENLNYTKDTLIEKSIRIAFIKKVPIILDLSGVGLSFFQRETARKLLSRYDIDVVVGTIKELNYLLEEDEEMNLKNLRINSIKDEVELRKRIRRFCKRYGTVVLLGIDRYYLTDGFSEFYIGFLTNRLKEFKYVLPALVSVGVSTSKEKEKKFKGILISTMTMSVINKEVENLEREVYLDDIIDILNNLSPKKLSELSEIQYGFSR